MLTPALREAGYAVRVEGKPRGARNIVIGDIEKAEVLYTAHYDTCAVLAFPNFITPKNLFIFILFQIVLAAGILVPTVALTFLAAVLTKNFFVGYFTMLGSAIASIWMMMAGPANKHTANDNTSGVVTVLETALAMPADCRARAAYVLFDLEELGLIGSSAFARRHSELMRVKPVINFDCVSDGDSLHLCMTRSAKKESGFAERLSGAFCATPGKKVTVERGFFIYPSDQMAFRKGVGVCALKESRLIGCYMNRIHTPRDVVFDEANIELLKQGAVRFARSAD